MRSPRERALSWAEVDEIRARLVNGESARAIAVEYGVSRPSVSRAARGVEPYDGVGNHPIPTHCPQKQEWKLPEAETSPELTSECRLCGCEFDPHATDSAGLYCSELCEYYGSDEDRRFGGLGDRPRDLLIQINDNPDRDHTGELVELHDSHQMSPDRLAQHTPYGDVTIRETLRSEGVYHGIPQPTTEPDFRARYEDPDFPHEQLGLAPRGEIR